MTAGRPDPGPRGPQWSLRPTAPSVLLRYGLVALLAGWLVHWITDRWGTPPVVTWTQPTLVFVIAGLVGVVAFGTWRTLQVHHERITSSQAVNRLVLARASAIVGSVVAGGYLGYAISWIGSQDELAGQRAWRSAACVVAGLLWVAAGLVLERACRIRDDDPRA